MIKVALIWIVFFLWSFILAQEYIPWESYYSRDTLYWQKNFDFDVHSSIHPRINRRNNRVSIKKEVQQTTRQFSLLPVTDFVFGHTKSVNQYRGGAGFAFDYLTNTDLNIKFAYTGGFSNSNTINYNGGVYPFGLIRKPYGITGQYFYHDIRTRVSYSLNKFFNFQIGIDNNRFGEGDRSILLDDYGTPYPFAMMRLKVWRIEYVWLQSYFQNPNERFTSTRPKHGATHYLSMNLLKGFNLSFFETIVYDGLVGNQRRGIEWEYMNPFVIYRPLEFTIGSTDKVQLGANLSYRFNNFLTLFSQVMIDEFKINIIRERKRNIVNKFGFQFGFKGEQKTKDGFVFYSSELNLVRPFTYSHMNPGQTYSNMTNPLAHPLGSNFVENSSRILYKSGLWDFSFDFVYYLKGLDFKKDESWGGDINLSIGQSPLLEDNTPKIEGFYIGSGNKTNVAKIHTGIGYTILPKQRIRMFITLESFWWTQNQKTTYYQGVFFGLRSELWNDRRNY